MGWWLLAGAVLSFLPFYVRRVGLWTMIIAGYLFGVFLVGGANARFFGAAWPILTLLLPVPIDALLRGIRWRRSTPLQGTTSYRPTCTARFASR